LGGEAPEGSRGKADDIFLFQRLIS